MSAAEAPAPAPPQPAPGRPVANYILFRQLVGLGLLVLAVATSLDQPDRLSGVLSGVLAQTLGVPLPAGRLEVSPLNLAGVLFLVMGVSAAMLPRFGDRPWFAWSQLLIDTVFATALVSITDGPTSPYFPLYFANIVAAAWLLPSARGPVVIAVLDAAAFGAVLAVRGVDWLRLVIGEEPLLAYSQITLQVFAFVLVGLLSGMLSRNLRAARAALAQQVKKTEVLQERHDLVLDQLDSGVVVTSAEGVVQSANPWATRVLGVRAGMPLNRQLDVAGRRWEQVFQHDGELLSLLCSTTEMVGGGRVVLIEDVTRLREMEAAIARDERLTAVGRLAAGLAHEIRNPLASLSGSVQLLREQGRSPLHDIVLREVKRLNELVEEFLDSARPVRLDLDRVDPGAVIGEVATAFRNDARYQGKRVVRTHAVRLPLVRMDGGRFRQVLWNLLLNAAQATPDFGTIELRADVDDGSLLVHVQDDGVGIAPDRLRRIFDPFYTTRTGGTGLGLANVDRIVRAHDGTIEVESVPGRGTLFTLRFPLRGPAQHPQEEAISAR